MLGEWLKTFTLYLRMGFHCAVLIVDCPRNQQLQSELVHNSWKYTKHNGTGIELSFCFCEVWKEYR